MIWSSFLTDSLLAPPYSWVFSDGLPVVPASSREVINPELVRAAAAPISFELGGRDGDCGMLAVIGVEALEGSRVC